MTEVIDHPIETAPTRPERPRRGGTAGRWRVAARLARRQVARTKLSSLLVVILVALPIAGMTAFLIFGASSIPTTDERARVELGETQAWISPVGPPGAGMWQVPTEPDWTGYPTTFGDGSTSDPVSDLEPLADPSEALPAGTETLAIGSGRARVESPAGIAIVEAWTGPAWDPRLTGRFDLVEGARPDGADEAMVTTATLERLGVRLGGEIVLATTGDRVTIVGVLDAAILPDDRAAVFLPEALADAVIPGGERRWYVPDLVLSWADVQELNEQGVIALSREVLFDPPTDLPEDIQRMADQRWMSIWSMIASLAVGGLFAAYVVVMLAGAAFAVAARRQQRALAIAASVGATGRDLFRIVVLQGTALGAVGGAIGLALGVGATAALQALTASGNATNPWGFHVPWQGLAAIFVFAVLVGTASALVPARSVARTDAIHALRGARKPVTPRASRPLWGSLLLLVGVALTLTSAVALAALNAPDSEILPWDSPLRTAPVWGIVIGPILVQVGILISGRWLLWMTSKGLSRLSTSARIASRDAAANAARTVPAFAAIGATVFLGVFATAQASMTNAHSARTWYYTAPVGSASAEVWAGMGSMNGELDSVAASSALEAANDLFVEAGAEATATISRQVEFYNVATASDLPADVVRALAVLPEEHLLDPKVQDSYTGPSPQNNLSVIAPGELATVLGVDLSPTEVAAYRDGDAVVTDGRYVVGGAIDVDIYSLQDHWEGRTPDNMWIRLPGMPATAEPLREESIAAIEIDAPAQPVVVAIAPETAARLGMTTQPEKVVASFADIPSVAAQDRLRAQAELLSTSEVTTNIYVETGPSSPASWMVPLLAAVSVLVVGASAVALGLARFERRPDDATLAAVGGTPALRRRIAFWQGFLVAGFGTVAGAAAGVLPAVGFSIQSRGMQQLGDVPWVVLAAFAIALPLVIALANAVVPPRRADLTRRTVIA